MRQLKLGVIGISDGNGHPYSWASIFNGYQPKYMANCGFPAIPEYLAKKKFPRDSIDGASVTHIWTQDKAVSEHIAKSAFVSKVVLDYMEMIGLVDAILLARDDFESHLEIAPKILSSGIPVYIDKPLAIRVSQARQLFDQQQYPGQIFTCSALRYAKEFHLTKTIRKSIGKLGSIHAFVPKDWERYAIHVLEPILLIPELQGAVIKRHALWKSGLVTELLIEYENEIEVHVHAMGDRASPISIKLFGDAGNHEMLFKDSYSAFKAALEEFVGTVREPSNPIDENFVLDVVKLIELGL